MPVYHDSLSFENLFSKRVAARFDQPRGSSDGGGILLRAADRRLGLIDRLRAALGDTRQAGKITHEVEELLAQRIFGLALGYPDANDAARLADDPLHKLLVGRDPLGGAALASQPTLSRFENGVGRKALFRMGEALAEAVIAHQRRCRRGRARIVWVDLDAHEPGHIRDRHRLSRPRLRSFLAELPPATVLLEACGSAHFWARHAQSLGHRAVLLPPTPPARTCCAIRPIAPTPGRCSKRPRSGPSAATGC